MTDRTKQVLEFIRTYVQSHAYAPSYREIAAGIGLASTSNVAYHITRLLAAGAIHMERGKPRTITIAPGSRAK